MNETTLPDHDVARFEAEALRHPGEPMTVPFLTQDVGGQVIAIASEGLYSDPRDALREFAQNGVDAGASEIGLQFTGRNVAVTDDGAGMGFTELLRARRFGRSDKSATINVGFRGIGIYSAFHLCDRLSIVTQQAGVDKRWTMTFDFAAMREVLRDHEGQDDLASALGTMIEENTTIYYDVVEDPGGVAAGTVAILENLDTDAYGELMDWESLRDYLQRTLPVPFAGDFEHRAAIEAKLREEVADYGTVRVRVSNDDTALDEMVVRSYPSGLESPEFRSAQYEVNGANRRAFIWACSRPRLTLREDAGIYFKKRGFTIGDGQELREWFSKRPMVYQWYVGEVYVLDPNVRPNSARNGFEKNSAYRALWLSLEAPMQSLLTAAESMSQIRRADEIVMNVERAVGELVGKVDNATAREELVRIFEALGRARYDVSQARLPTTKPAYEAIRRRRDHLLDTILIERARIDEILLTLTAQPSPAPGDEPDPERDPGTDTAEPPTGHNADDSDQRDGTGAGENGLDQAHREGADAEVTAAEHQGSDQPSSEPDVGGTPNSRRSFVAAFPEDILAGPARSALLVVEDALRETVNDEQYAEVLSAVARRTGVT